MPVPPNLLAHQVRFNAFNISPSQNYRITYTAEPLELHNASVAFKVEPVQHAYVTTVRTHVSEESKRFGSTMAIYKEILVASFESCEQKILELSFPDAAVATLFLLFILA
ncbi:hypothetical protein EVAR_83245_1 [Eumeta japonica]|uniref:Uncharacterized protein n=1 Tax=Eumeta variegata TaxID=151549 RepID=A0A4C1Y5U0_EUMVA|nr:hypothetical protein EVAR_83245_1 [Eumeta japonica]